jgi:uridine kinase
MALKITAESAKLIFKLTLEEYKIEGAVNIAEHEYIQVFINDADYYIPLDHNNLAEIPDVKEMQALISDEQEEKEEQGRH